MNKKGLTASFIFEAESANYGEGLGNVTSLKKLSRGGGDSYTYISRQALRYNIINQMGVDNTPVDVDGNVLQFAPDASIEDYAEIDLFGYMKTTKKPTQTRSAVVRLSNAVSLESFNADLDFLTNKSLFDRYTKENENMDYDDLKKKRGIAQSEIHKSYYAYTITIDLEKVGIDENEDVEISNEEKTKRVNKLLEVIKFLYRDIKGRRETLSPIFAVGGVYDIKNPFFENKVKVRNNKISVKTIKSIYGLDNSVKSKTRVGLIEGIFDNDKEIINELNAVSMGDFFADIKEEVEKYYSESR